MGQLIFRPRKASDWESVGHEQPCVLLKFSPITEENHPPPPPDEIDDGEGAGREEMRRKKRFWRWHSRRKNYNIAKAEKLNQSTVAITNWRRIDDLQEVPVNSSGVFPTSEAQLEQEVLQPAVLITSVSPSADDNTDSPVSFSAHNNIDSAVGTTVYESIDSAVSTKVYGDIDCAGRPTEMPEKDCISCQYKLGEKLGKGGFGTVHKGIRIRDGLKVAVKFVRKTPHTKYISTPFHPEPLPLEIALAVISNRGPSCPNIIQVLDWQDDPEHYVMIMEHPLPSMDMHKFLKLNRGVLKEHTAQHIMRQVIYAISICCYRGVFHGDIKLTNLLINLSTLQVKLIDFGCGDLMRDSGYMSLRGTIPYIPPEYYDTGKYHAKPTTVFSLGVLLFKIVHGCYPTAQDHYDLANNDWSRFVVSRECCHFMQGCLQRHPEHRLPLEHMHCHDWLLLGFPVHVT